MGVLKYVRVDWRQVVALLVLTLLGAATEMGLPTLLARMIDDGVAAGAQEVIVGIAVAMVVLALVGCVSSFASMVLSVELFSTSGFIYFALACIISYMLSGYSGLYREQRIVYSKLKAEYINKQAE